MRTITLKEIENLIKDYLEIGGEVRTIQEGVLGYGTLVCEAHGYKTVVVRERYVNSWVSEHTFRLYNKTPKKYE